MANALNHGLSPEQIVIIKTILAPYADNITKVDLFGSRAKGTHRSNSDIDLVLHGSVDEKTVDRLWSIFAESNLPFKIDIQAYALIQYPPLKRHIDEVSQTLLTQNDLQTTSKQ